MVCCYGLERRFAQGAQVVPFLVKMAKLTMVGSHQRVIPYPEEATAESWASDQAGHDPGPGDHVVSGQ